MFPKIFYILDTFSLRNKKEYFQHLFTEQIFVSHPLCSKHSLLGTGMPSGEENRPKKKKKNSILTELMF